MSYVYLTAPRDLQNRSTSGSLSFSAKSTVPNGQGATGISSKDIKDYRRRGREVYKDAVLVYAICHPDMSVGLGPYKQLSRARHDKVPRRVLPLDSQTFSLIEDFELEKTNRKNPEGADNIFKFDLVRPIPTVPTTP